VPADTPASFASSFCVGGIMTKSYITVNVAVRVSAVSSISAAIAPVLCLS
jgi:hypothetical protein